MGFLKRRGTFLSDFLGLTPGPKFNQSGIGAVALLGGDGRWRWAGAKVGAENKSRRNQAGVYAIFMGLSLGRKSWKGRGKINLWKSFVTVRTVMGTSAKDEVRASCLSPFLPNSPNPVFVLIWGLWERVAAQLQPPQARAAFSKFIRNFKGKRGFLSLPLCLTLNSFQTV